MNTILYLIDGEYYIWSVRNGGLLLFGLWSAQWYGKHRERMK